MEQCVLSPGANGVLPPPPPPGTVDELGPFFALYNTCRAMNANAPAEVASLINDVSEIVDSSHCVIDTSSIISVRAEPALFLVRDGVEQPMSEGELRAYIEDENGRLAAQGEYTGVSVRRRGDSDLSFGGWYVQAGYFLTGEQRNYDRQSGKYKRITPKAMVGDGGIGAWEIAARYSEMDLSSKDVRGGKERNVTLGLNWWLNRSLMLRFNYVYANPDPTSDEIVVGGRDEKINIFEGRAQVVF